LHQPSYLKEIRKNGTAVAAYKSVADVEANERAVDMEDPGVD